MLMVQQNYNFCNAFIPASSNVTDNTEIDFFKNENFLIFENENIKSIILFPNYSDSVAADNYKLL